MALSGILEPTAFMKPKIYDQYTLIITNGQEQFRTIIKIVKDYGFQKIYKEQDEEPQEEMQEFTSIDEAFLKSLKEIIKGLAVNAIKKTKPKYFTPATLLTAMMNAGKTLEDKESREIMAEVEGLGTAATRQLYPVELEKDGFIEKKGKNLISTIKGKKLIELIAPGLKSVEKTAEMEKKLRLIESGTYNFNVYRKEIDGFVNTFLAEATSQKQTIESSFKVTSTFPKFESQQTSLGSCSCGGNIIESPKAYNCDKCKKIVWKEIASKRITKKQVVSLMQGKKVKIEGFKSKEKKPFNATLYIDTEGKVKFDFSK